MKFLWTISLLFLQSSFANEAIEKNSYFDFKSSEKVTLNSDANKYIDLILVVDDNSLWTKENMMSHIKRTQRTLKLCHIQIRNIEFINVDLPQKTITQLQVSDPYAGPPELKIANEGVPTEVVTGFMLRTINNKSIAFAMNISSVIRSERFPTMPSFRPLLNTFWISDNHITNTSTPNAEKSYSTLAHELLHIIGDLGHLENNMRPNLMGGNDNFSKSYYINPEQCRSSNLFNLLY
jgi:hypothetical protein